PVRGVLTWALRCSRYRARRPSRSPLSLPARSRLPENADASVLQGLAASGKAWGRFDVRIEGASLCLPVIAFFMNLRSRATGIATGDQAIFVRREAFEGAGRFPPLELMEDIALSRSLKRSEEHTSELQSPYDLVCRLLL